MINLLTILELILRQHHELDSIAKGEEDELIHDADIPECLQQCVTQLEEYFRRARKEFSISLQLQGTDFEKQVWKTLFDIPYGTTRTYMDIAKAIGNTKAVRAVGLANGKNPIAIIIPCHRVIGSDGRLTGYGGGIWRKKWLLKHEGAYLLQMCVIHVLGANVDDGGAAMRAMECHYHAKRCSERESHGQKKIRRHNTEL